MDNNLDPTGIRKSFGMSLLYTLPMFLITFMFITGGRPDFKIPASALAMMIDFYACECALFPDALYRKNRQVTGQSCLLFLP